MDEIYDALFVNRIKDLSTALGVSSTRKVIDGLGVDGAGWLARVFSSISMWWDKWVVDGLVNFAGKFTRSLSHPIRMLQTGVFSSYAVLILLGLVDFAGVLRPSHAGFSAQFALKGDSHGSFLNHLLSVVLFTPLVGALLLLFIPRGAQSASPPRRQSLWRARLCGFHPAGAAFPGGQRWLHFPWNPPNGFLPSARNTHSALMASACCWSCSPPSSA